MCTCRCLELALYKYCVGVQRSNNTKKTKNLFPPTVCVHVRMHMYSLHVHVYHNSGNVHVQKMHVFVCKILVLKDLRSAQKFTLHSFVCLIFIVFGDHGSAITMKISQITLCFVQCMCIQCMYV